MLNSIVLMGRLVGDPELRSTTSNVPVCSFRIAVDRDYQRAGEEKQTDFIDIVTWKSTAEFVTRYFSKGSLIVVQGSLQSRKWQDKDGNNRIVWEVQAERVHFGGSKKDSESGSSDKENASRDSDATSNNEAQKNGYPGVGGSDFVPLPDEDLPF